MRALSFYASVERRRGYGEPEAGVNCHKRFNKNDHPDRMVVCVVKLLYPNIYVEGVATQILISVCLKEYDQLIFLWTGLLFFFKEIQHLTIFHNQGIKRFFFC